jgi:hypothetical protein
MYTIVSIQDSKDTMDFDLNQNKKPPCRVYEKKRLYAILGLLFGFSIIGFTMFYSTKFKSYQKLASASKPPTTKFSASKFKFCNQSEGAFIECYNDGICIQFPCFNNLCLKCICAKVDFLNLFKQL